MIKKKSLDNDDYRIVYSDDPDMIKKKNSIQSVEITPSKIFLHSRLEKNQRAGKVVTVILGFPSNDEYLNELTKKLKNHCGCGGTVKNNTIELQGDHKDKAHQFLGKLGFKFK